MLRFSIDKELSLAQFLPQVQPFLSLAGINLSNFEIGATLSQLEGQADFAGSEWTGLSAQAETAPGPLFSFTPDTSPANPLAVLVGSAGSRRRLQINLAAADGTAHVTAEVPGLAVQSTGGAEHAHIDASVAATLSHGTGASPLFSKIRGTVGDLWAAIEGARRAFGANSQEKTPFAWKVKLANDVAAEPALAVSPDRLKLRLRAEPSFVSLGRSTRVDFSSSIVADLSLQENQLILDALTQMDYDVRWGSLGVHRTDLKLPLLFAFGDVLQPVNAPQGLLWDSQRYSAFWDRYRPMNAIKDSLQWTEVALGPIEFEELSIVPPLHAAIELSKDLVQLDLPVKGGFLYGESAGLLQSQLRWAGDETVLDSFLGWSVQNAQSEALRVATRFGYSPLVQDRIGLSLTASAREMRLSGRILEAALADPSSFNQSDKMALDLELGSVPGMTGRLQFESDFDVKHMNDLLRQIRSDFRLTLPPETMSWASARMNIRLKDGAIENDVPVLVLTGMQGARNNLAQLSGTLRLFAGRDRSTPFQDIVHSLLVFDERLR